MFTTDQIKAAHSKVKSGADFPQYVQDIIALGVSHYDMYVADGHTDYFGTNGYSTSSGAKYDELQIEDAQDLETFVNGLKDHQAGNTDYPSFIAMCAQCGVYKWTVSTQKMTCAYYDKAGNEMLVEAIPASR